MKTIGKFKNVDEIPVGEIFAYNGCWVIVEKIAKNKYRILAHDDYRFGDFTLSSFKLKKSSFDERWLIADSNESYVDVLGCYDFNTHSYKLSKATQRLWKQ